MSPTASVPQFSIKQYKFKIPSLKLLSEALAKHLTSETEIQLFNGCLTDESIGNLRLLETKMSVLQYKKIKENL